MRTSIHSRSSALIGGFLLCLIIPLSGCTMFASKPAATPPLPKPAVVQPPPPEPPLSLAQTVVVLPSPQAVNPDAIPAAVPVAQAPPPEKPAPTPTRGATRRASTGNANTPPKTTAEPAEADADPPPAPPAEEQPRILPLVTPDEQKRIKTAMEGRRKQIDDLVTRSRAHHTAENKALGERIESFLAQSAEAEKRSDYTQAEALSIRALILAQELQVE